MRKRYADHSVPLPPVPSAICGRLCFLFCPFLLSRGCGSAVSEVSAGVSRRSGTGSRSSHSPSEAKGRRQRLINTIFLVSTVITALVLFITRASRVCFTKSVCAKIHRISDELASGLAVRGECLHGVLGRVPKTFRKYS